MMRLVIKCVDAIEIELLGDADIPIQKRCDPERRKLQETLPVLVQEMLECPELKDVQLDEILVDVGPGKWMSLRTSIAFARGLGLALSVPVYGFQHDDYTAKLAPAPVYESDANVVANVPEPIVDLKKSAAARVEKYTIGSGSRTFEEDLADFYNIEKALFTREAWSLTSIEEALKSGIYTFFIVRDDASRIVASSYLRKDFDGVFDIDSVAVLPEFQGCSLGKMLMESMFAEVALSGGQQVFLEVRSQNARARKLYEKCGFLDLRVIKKYYLNPMDDAIVMTATAPFGTTGSSTLRDHSNSAVSLRDEKVATPAQSVVSGAKYVLGIESSCDETGAAVVSGGKVIGSSLATSLDQHVVFGGVIPEIASRMHLEYIEPTVLDALTKAGLSLHDISAVSVTAAPGLTGCLNVGVGFAKGLAVGLKVPIYGVNHVVGHILAASLDAPLPHRYVALIASGGHTSLVLVDGLDFTPLGGTLDDAAGEAFDKVGRLLGLEYPAGPKIDCLAENGDKTAIKFPYPLLGPKFDVTHKFDFSFSGLKTAAVRELERQKSVPEPRRVSIEDFCASFSDAVAHVLVAKTLRAVTEYDVKAVVLGGGFSANSQLRAKMQDQCASLGVELILPPLKLCTDNGEMIANLGEMLLERGDPPSDLSFPVKSTLSLAVPQV